VTWERGGRAGEISPWTAEYHDVLLEQRYWSDSAPDLAHWASTAGILCCLVTGPLAAVDVANVGFSPRLVVLLALRCCIVLAAVHAVRLLRARPHLVRDHRAVAGMAGLLLTAFSAVALLQPDRARLEHLQMGLLILTTLVILPNRLPYALAVGGVGATCWVAVDALVRESPGQAILAQVVAFAITLAVGWATALLLGSTRRQAYSSNLGAELANERLRAEITLRERMESDLVRKANTDPLTQVANRRHFEEQARDEFLRCQRTHQPLSLLVLDVDHFKWINDTHGHPAGDDVLRLLSDALAEHVRRIDLVGRLGGEEFAVVMPGADLERAEEAAERLRERIATLRVELPSGIVRLTVSIGVTECDVWTEQLGDAVARADEAMYRAKSAGRDRVVAG